MIYSIVPSIIGSKKILFYDEKNIKVNICNDSKLRYLSPFQIPFLIIDTFAKKTTKPEEIVSIDVYELKKFGYMVTSIKAGNKRWFSSQRVIYRIESTSNPTPGSKKIDYVPNFHKILKDIVNNKIRIVGPNAGYPRVGGGGPWIDIQ